MDERKYIYQRPKDTEERIEAVYEELSYISSNQGVAKAETLKDHVISIRDSIRQAKHERTYTKYEEESRLHHLQRVLFSLFFLLFLLVVSKSGEWAWLDANRTKLRLWEIAIAAVFVGISIERSTFFQTLWSFGFTKLIASIGASALLIFCTGKASALMNSIFPVDASALPFSRAFITGFMVFQYSYPLLIAVIIFAILHATNTYQWVYKYLKTREMTREAPVHSVGFLLMSLVLMISWTIWMRVDFSEDQLPEKAYRLSRILDFNSNHPCTNLPKDVVVVFLGTGHSRVLVDSAPMPMDDLESFVSGSGIDQSYAKERFSVQECALSAQGAPSPAPLP